MVEVATEQHLVHAAQVLFVHQVLVAQQLLVDIDLRRLQLGGRDDAISSAMDRLSLAQV